MAVLNLVDPKRGHIFFKISRFPDGQQNIDIPVDLQYNDVEIWSRFNSWLDLELIVAATKALRRSKPDRKISLYIPYLLGARSDRQFVEGGNSYLVDVVAPVINSLNFSEVHVLDPHSDVAAACINNLKKTDNIGLVRFALTNIDNKNDAQERTIFVSPDAGAYKKIFDVAKKFKVNNIITASKVRDLVTGNIIKTEINIDQEPGQRNYVIIDDICDGGRTFIELSKAIREKRPKAIYNDGIYLIVTHGIFSAGFDQLNQYFDGIYTTNSVKDVADQPNLKQLNVF